MGRVQMYNNFFFSFMQNIKKKNQLTEDSQKYLLAMEEAFGKEISDIIKERLQGLSEDDQCGLCWHLLHYIFRDEIQSTGSPSLDLHLVEVIEQLPVERLKLLKLLYQKKVDYKLKNMCL